MTDHRNHLAVVIVTWNTRDLVVDCLQSVFDELDRSPFHGDAWVVDNASTDGTIDAIHAAFPTADYPALHVLTPGDNLGFAAGNNHALREIGFPGGTDLPDFVLLLNPDTIVQPGAFAALVGGMESVGAGLAGARLIYGDGSFQHSAFAFPGLFQLFIDLFPVPGRLHESSLNGRYPRALYEAGQPFEVGHPLGATFLLRREVIEQVGMFDEQFFLYCEEVDWAMRISQAGWRVVCVPAAVVVHLEGRSTGQVKPTSIINLWTARLQYYRKHYAPVKRYLAHRMLRAGMNRFIRMVARDSSVAEDIRTEVIAAYLEVIRLSRKI